MANSASYERPQEDLTNSMRGLGKEVQLTTFKTNEKCAEKQQPEARNIGIACVGTCNFWDKIVYIRHFFQDKPSISDSNCIIGVETLEREVIWDKEKGSILDVNPKVDFLISDTQSQRETQQEQSQESSQNSSEENKILLSKRKIPLQLHLSIVGQRMPDKLAKLFLARQDSKVGIIGAVVFCSASNTTLQAAVAWKNVVQEALQSNKEIPIVLVIENINSTIKWMGDGNFVEDEESMNEYCMKTGFASWMEMRKSDWSLGKRNVFGRAVNVILKHELCSDLDFSKTMK